MKLFDYFRRNEQRADSSYSSALVALLTGSANGQVIISASATAALEACAGLVGRAFAACDVHGPDYVEEALDPSTMMLIGRSLIKDGEIIFKIEVMDGKLMLWPATSHDVVGGHDPRTWGYRVDMAGPDIRMTQERVHADSVCHFTYSTETLRPWKGLSPLGVAKLAGRLSAEVAGALADEASGPRGSFMPYPKKDGKDPTLEGLMADIKVAKGGLLFVESMKAALEGGTAPPQTDWIQRRLGFSAPDSMIKLMNTATMEVISACGLSADLWMQADGTGKREAWRQALFGVVQPLGKLVESELRKKLDAPDLKLDWKELRASDLQARARSFKGMVDAGMSLEKAAALSGLLLPEDE